MSVAGKAHLAFRWSVVLFPSFVQQQLPPGTSFSLAVDDDGHPVLRFPNGESLTFEPDCVILDGDEATAVESLCSFGYQLRRIHDFLARFPVELQRGDERLVLSLALPAGGTLWSDEGLTAAVRLTRSDAGGAVTREEEGEHLVVTDDALRDDDWNERLASFDARLSVDRFDAIGPDDGRLERPLPPPEDDGWAALAEQLGLDAEAFEPRVAHAAEVSLRTLVGVRSRYREVYGLELPSGLAHLAAVVAALGELPENPDPEAMELPEAGWRRGGLWLEAALGMTPAGLLDWFAPGGLDRATHDAALLHPGMQGPLDERLDQRYRCDAPQLVGFLGGDSDGLHWGFWYDSPAYFPVIASNYARDSAETWLCEEEEVTPFLVDQVASALDEVMGELRTTDDELRPIVIARWRALRVVSAHLDAVVRWAAGVTQPEEPRCPWPRTEGWPPGSPRLALRPGSGTVPDHLYALAGTNDLPSVAQRRAWIDEARRELDAGRPSYAHALGLYLHWLDAEDLRELAGQLLIDAYERSGWDPFASILRVHLRYRDLPSVGVFGDERRSGRASPPEAR